ncbi:MULTISPECIES: energy transducer TonB [Shewanella]|jgi:TonB family protein|uniref:energy transducer TonB n=1 Tax=Shewanella TaxID=22 RepID=UPI001183FB27|nr:energy transducer TonB [Shewanella algae]MBO2560277.1 energy transducer TonB [Shewanella algae]MBO2619591.1 energy transducer TonB [Shewanella algae]MBO2644773.1 energy transducer TonB [Shewanella algae]MBO2661711.1 energy transducer TonB [Shewanella algae]MCL1052891.1 energy transducer TonB [Shewanella algae]
MFNFSQSTKSIPVSVSKLSLLLLPLIFGTAQAGLDESYQAYQQALEKGDKAQIISAAEQAYADGKAKLGATDRTTLALSMNLAKALQQPRNQMLDEQGIANQQRSEALYLQALQSYQALYGEQALEVLDPMMGLAHSSNPKEAAKLYQQAIALADGKNDRLLSAAVRLEAFHDLNSTEAYDRKVRAYALDAQKIYHELAPKDSLQRVNADTAVAAIYLAEQKYAKAKPLLMEVIEQLEVLPFDTPLSLTAHAYLVELYSRNGEEDKATQHCQAIGNMRPWQQNLEQKPLFRIAPSYPTQYAKLKREGWVDVEVTVNEQGSVSHVEVLDSKGGKQFETETVKALSKWRYAPKFVDGKPVIATTRSKLEFRMSFN